MMNETLEAVRHDISGDINEKKFILYSYKYNPNVIAAYKKCEERENLLDFLAD